MRTQHHDLILTSLISAVLGALIGAMFMTILAAKGEPCNAAPDPIACLIERAGP
jgi:hypothetical protein